MTDLVSETIIIKARRVYHCDHPDHNSMLLRKNVYKDAEGKYHCNSDHSIVRDVTDTTTGHDFLEIVHPS